MSAIFTMKVSTTKGGFKSEETGAFLHLQDQNKYIFVTFFFLIEKAPDKKVSPLVRILIQFSIQKRAYFLSNQV